MSSSDEVAYWCNEFASLMARKPDAATCIDVMGPNLIAVLTQSTGAALSERGSISAILYRNIELERQVDHLKEELAELEQQRTAMVELALLTRLYCAT